MHSASLLRHVACSGSGRDSYRCTAFESIHGASPYIRRACSKLIRTPGAQKCRAPNKGDTTLLIVSEVVANRLREMKFVKC